MNDIGDGMIFAIIWFTVNIALLIWAYNDAEKRSQNGCLVAVLILFAGAPGIIVWLLIRDKLGE